MAVTSIWAVSNHVNNTIRYVMNPEKTIDRPELSQDAIAARKAVGDTIDYASNGDKTEQMMYVTGINCNPDHAADEFMKTKLLWNKTGGRLAYHGYQSFRESDGDLTAEKAHEIGVKMAEELWGDRFEVVVATHLNTGHLHNHFVLNSVSLKDGYKYHRTMADYWQMKEVSDRLCREAKLHVVEIPSNARGKTYYEWSSEREGKTTIRGRIREDIDYAIKLSRSEREFANTMKEWGYEFKFYRKDGTELVHPGIKPPGAKGYFRFDSLGEQYRFETIRRRVIENSTVPGTPLLIENKPYRKWEPPKDEVLKGLPYVYRCYCIRLYSYISKPKKREYIPMALREDIIKLDQYIEQLDFLYGNKIEGKNDLSKMRQELNSSIKALSIRRRRLYYDRQKAIRENDGLSIKKIMDDIQVVSKQIRELKRKAALCDAVYVSSDDVLKRVNAPDKKPIVPTVPGTKKSLTL
ncbi:MAG: relaxase/mobilization nuclease domain-containing protein [Saccharofermentans sp.]|nr:relaxase/mobilization nuclease domain-containing protein [Saccharofermentans sp.]